MIRNSYRNIPYRKKQTQYLMSVFIVCLSFSLVFLFYDDGPPKPPFPDSFSSIDCRYVNFRKYNDRSGQFDFYFDIQPSIEYPPEYLPYFIKIQFFIDGAMANFTAKQFQNITQTDNLLKVSFNTPLTGPADYCLRCLNRLIMSGKVEMKPPVVLPNDRSYSYHIPNSSIAMSDVCIEYEKFLYFNDFPAYLNELYFDNKTFRFEFLQYPFSAYVKMKNVTVHDNVSFLISPFHKIPWKQLFFNVNPIAYELNKRLFAFPDKLQFVFRDDPDMAAAPILSLFSSRNLTKIEDIHCFSNLVITETDSDIPININAKLNYQVVKDFSFTRMRFERNKTVKNRILVQDKYYDPIISRLDIKDCEIISFSPDMDLINASILVSSSNVLIGDHISVLCHLLWMNDDSFVIDLTSPKYSCNRWIDIFSKNSPTKVFSLNNLTTCECPSFQCYPEESEIQFGIDFDKVIQIIKENL